MTDYYYKEESTDKGTSPIKIALLGALAGAVGTGVAMALSSPKNREKIQHSMNSGQKWMDKTIKDFKSTAEDLAKSSSETAEKLEKGTDQATFEAKQAVRPRQSIR